MLAWELKMSEPADDLSRLVDALDDLGSEPIEVDEARLEAVQTRVIERLADHEDTASRRTVVAMSGRRRPFGALMLGAVAASLIAIVALVGFFAADDTSLVIAAADGVDVTLPGGETIPGSVGLELPEGAEVEVAGFIEISGVRYGVGSYVVTNDELLLVDDVEPAEVFGQREPDPSTGDDGMPVVAATSTTTLPDGAANRPGTTMPADRPSTSLAPAAPRPTSVTPSTVRAEPSDSRPAPVTTRAPQPSPTDAPRQTVTTVAATERTTAASTRPPATTAPARPVATTTSEVSTRAPTTSPGSTGSDVSENTTRGRDRQP